MPKTKLFKTLSCALALSALSACSQHLVTATNQPMTEAEADDNIAARLEFGSKVQKQVGDLRDVFGKIDAILRDLGKLTGKAVEQTAGEALVDGIDMLPKLFGGLSRSVVRTEVDGTWSMEAQIPSGPSLGDLVSCPGARARVTGKRVLDQQDVVLYLSDCGGTHWDRLAKWIVHSDGAIDLSYWPLVRANLRPIAGQGGDVQNDVGGGCTMGLSASRSEIYFGCAATKKKNVSIGNLSIRDLPQGTAVSAAVNVRHIAAGPHEARNVDVLIDLQPQSKPWIQVCRNGGAECKTL